MISVGGREISFRGMSKDVSGMVYGNLIMEDEIIFIENSAGKFEVFESTVGQDSGLRDRKGNPFYEGDIVNLFPDSEDSESLVLVAFENGRFKAKSKSPINEDLYQLKDLVEVVGNVYENEDLIKFLIRKL